MERNKWFLMQLKSGKYMVAWNVKDENEAIIIGKSYIIRKNIDFDFELESIVEIQGLTDSKLIGIEPILANN